MNTVSMLTLFVETSSSIALITSDTDLISDTVISW